MAKKKKKTGIKRNLKYGTIVSPKAASPKNRGVAGKLKEKPFESETNPEFKKELRRNLLFVGGFFLILVILYLTLTKTNLLNPILAIFGLDGIYK